MSGGDTTELLDGFRTLVGYVVETTPQRAKLTLELGPKHLNRAGVLHGGVLMTAFDSACGYACMAGHDDPETPSLVTVTMTTNFIKSLDGGTLYVDAWLTGGGRSTVFAEARAYDAKDRTVGTASGTFRRLRGRPKATG